MSYKIVVFHVNFSPYEEILDKNIDSDEFTIEGSKWKLQCNLNERHESNVTLKFAFTSGDIPETINYKLVLVNQKDPYKNICYNGLISRVAFLSDFMNNYQSVTKGTFGSKLICIKDLLKKKESFYPEGKLRFAAIIYSERFLEKSNFYKTKNLEDFKELYETMENADVTFEAYDGVKVPAHSHVLCAKSNFFKSYFARISDEKDSESRVIDTHNYHSDVIKDFIRFIYCEETFDELKSAKGKEIGLYYAANKYKFHKLKKICLDAIYENLLNTSDNVLNYLKFAKKFDIKTLQSCCVLIILVNYNSISKSDEWKDLKPSLLEMIYKRIFLKTENLASSTWISDDF